jgi:hypothetical protein
MPEDRIYGRVIRVSANSGFGQAMIFAREQPLADTPLTRT